MKQCRLLNSVCPIIRPLILGITFLLMKNFFVYCLIYPSQSSREQVWSCVWVFRWVHVCILFEIRSQLWVSFLKHHLPCFSDTASITGLELTKKVRLVVKQAPGILLSCLPGSGITSTYPFLPPGNNWLLLYTSKYQIIIKKKKTVMNL